MGGVPISARIVEAYVGEYASGKSEVAINRAISLLREGHRVTLVDLDLVEPFYTLRPIKKKLEEIGLDVVAWETSETLGLGEAGSVIRADMRWVLKKPNDVILDIGYGVEGAKVLNLVEGAHEDKDLRVYAVVNTGRPMTATVDDIVEYVKQLGHVDGLVNNSHLGDDTTLDFIEEGARVVTEAARILGLSVIATYMESKFRFLLDRNADSMGNPVKFLDRYMVDTFW